ncbi:MAG: GTPase Era [Chromatiaceae bacterium]|nr:GTPase Era [Chromatiaceae bacterium]
MTVATNPEDGRSVADSTRVRRCGFVAIAGRPNVGKSTLLNRLLGQKLAITSDKAQTTRHAVLGIRTGDRSQAIYVDTPGIHQRGRGALNRYLNRTARAAVADVDLVLFTVEALRFVAEDAKALRAVADAKVPAIAVVNKIDRVRDKRRLLPYIEDLSGRHAFRALVPVSATTGDQIDNLERLVMESLPTRAAIFPSDQITDRPERFFAAELLREQLTRRYGDELPYRTTVEIERFSDDGGRYRIDALVWVERPGQKRIIIGDRGESLKAAATRARLQMQEMFECPVHLDVWVKVKKSWSSDEAALASLGYKDV